MCAGLRRYVNTCWPTLVGMRRSSSGNKAVILAAARQRFAESGFERATIRAIAADANIDPSMVMRYFGSKDQLFAAAADFDLQFPDLSDVDREQLGARLVAHFLDRWERDEALVVLLRSSTTNDEAAQRMRKIFSSAAAAGGRHDQSHRCTASRRVDRHAGSRAGAVPLRAAASAGRGDVTRRGGGLVGPDGPALPKSLGTGYVTRPTIAPTMPTIVTTAVTRKIANMTNPRTCSQTAPF